MHSLSDCSSQVKLIFLFWFKKIDLASSGPRCSTWALAVACRLLPHCVNCRESGSVAGLVAPQHTWSEFLQVSVFSHFSRVQVFATLWPASLLYPWDSPGKNIGMGGHFLLQGIFLTQGWTHASCIAGRFFTSEPLGKPLIPWPGIKPMSSVLEGEVLITGPVWSIPPFAWFIQTVTKVVSPSS